MRLARSTIIVLMAGWISACSVSAPLSLQSTGDGSRPGISVALAIADEDAGTPRARFASALSQSLADNDFTLNPQGTLVADYSFALGDAADGLARGEMQADQPDWIAQPRKAGRLDRCKAQRMRATLVLFDRASGDVAYRGAASRVECDFSDDDVAAMANALVRDAITRAQ